MENQEEQPKQPSPQLSSSITYLSTLYHRNPGENPTALENNCRRELESDEQPYGRKCKATEEWEPLDFGWLTKGMNVSAIHIVNDEGRFLQKQPTLEQKAIAEAKVLEIAVAPSEFIWGVFLIHPGEPFYICPKSPGILRIRSLSGVARFTLTVFPR